MNGRQGCVVTVPDGFAPGTDVATLSLLGYDPHKYYDGRAPLEAVAQGLSARPDQLIFRCNFVTIVEGAMEDFTAGHISQREADQLIAELNQRGVGGDRCVFHSGVSYRNLMIASNVADMDSRCTPPHDFPGKPVASHAPHGPGAEWIRQVMDAARDVLEDHEINSVRRDLGENPATDIWLWGQGRPKTLRVSSLVSTCRGPSLRPSI